MNPPRDDPLQYCRFCFSQFRVNPLLSGGPKDTQLVNQISSLIQIELDPKQTAATSICSMCRQQLTEFQLFRDRCKHHDSIVREKVEEIQSSQKDMWFAVEPLGDCDEDSDEDDDTSLSKGDDPLQDVSGAESEKETRENFWCAISRDVGVISEHIKRALELTGFYRNASLGMISPTTIKQIEQDMREAVEFVISQGENRVEVLQQYYGSVHCKSPAKFKFLAGEVQTILSITAAVQENGIAEYLNKAFVSNGSCKYAVQKPDNADILAVKLIDKIRDYYKQRATDSKEFETFFARLPGVAKCDVRLKEDGTIYALLNCSYCNKNIQAFVDSRRNSWRYFNFVKHSKQHHRVERVEHIKTVKRKRPEGGDEENSMN